MSPDTNAKKKFSNQDLTASNFEDQDLSGSEFIKCELGGCLFKNCNLAGARFEKCHSTSGYVNFKQANLRGVYIGGCEFPNVDFEDAVLTEAEITACQFTGANLTNCNLDNSHLSGLAIPRAKLYLASFRNVRMEHIEYEPARRIKFRRILNALWKKDAPRQGTIFTAGTELSPFILFCTGQYRLEQLVAESATRGVHERIVSILTLLLFGIISDFGSSLWRWFATCCAIVLSFAVLYSWVGTQPFTNLDAYVYLSLAHFISPDLGSPGNTSWLFMSEGILGYFMLGILISIVTTKFFQRW